MNHTLKVQTKYYQMLKGGVKTIELRLYDEKRQAIQVGDLIRFSNLENPEDTFDAQVIRLYRATDFQQLCQEISPQQAGFTTTEDLIQTMVEFYPLLRQKVYGVVGIEIEINP